MRNGSVRMLFGPVAVLALVLASCAPAAAPPKSPSGEPTEATVASPAAKAPEPGAKPGPSATPAVEAPKYGGVLTSYIPGNPPSLDTQQESTINTSMIVAPFYTNLIQSAPLTNDKWAPGLAEKWEMGRDGLTWSFDIRQGVKFHDGAIFTTDDAVFNLKRLTDPPKGIVSNMSFLLKPLVKSIDKEGNKVKLAMNYPYAIMPDTLGHNYSAMYSQKYLEQKGDMKTTAMGTGPFKFKSYAPGVSIEGVRNPDFWVKERPYLDGYRFLFIKDVATQIASFRTGKVNITGKRFGTVNAIDMETLKKENPQLRFYPTASVLGSTFFMNMRKPPFQDLKVRKAISLVFDRQAAIKVLGHGFGIIGKPFPVEPWGHSKDELLKLPGFRQPKDQDMAEAKKLMQAAGYPDGFELTILARQMTDSKEPAVFMTNQLAQLGIKAKVQTLEDAVFWETGRKAAHEAMVYTPTWSITDPHWLGRYWVPGGALNFAGNEDDKELTKMWDEQIKIVDKEKRKALIKKIEEHLLETLPGVSILWPDVFIGIRPEVRNFAAGMGDSVGNTLQEIWLAK